ncbi:MAG TPA: hypothetical protein VHZ78_01045 [Rhizomicrobium sp.]|jgi:hypothetical protein|nr:hypothetical protein [Rhizomicrobium sp.]
MLNSLLGRGALSAAMFSAALCLAQSASVQAPAAAPQTWSDWQGNFRTVMDACVTANGTDCLIKAFNDRPRPPIDNPQHSVSGDLLYDLQTAQAMLAVPNAVNALWSGYGIDNVAYLGTGYSVPLTTTGAPESYWLAVQHEYFLPNLCAQAVDVTLCPTADPDVWTWQLTVPQVTALLGKPVAALLKGPPTQGDRKTLALRMLPSPKARADGLPQAFIRFGLLDPSWYKGTFGRPDARRVFFSDYAQLRTRTLRTALADTGSSSLITGAKPGQIFFVWLYVPGADTKAEIASWHALFAALQNKPAVTPPPSKPAGP